MTTKHTKITFPEMFFGYLLGPFGGLLASGIFASMLQQYFTDVLKLDMSFLAGLQLLSTILIVIGNLTAGQLIEHTKTYAGKARPWILVSAFLITVTSVLMFLVPVKKAAGLILIVVAYNLYYSVAFPIYNTANSTLVPVSTRDGKKRGALASLSNVAGLGVMGIGSMAFPVLVSFALKEDRRLWFLAMLVVALFSGLTIYLQYLFTVERVTLELMEKKQSNENKAKTISFRAQLKAVAGDFWWWITMIFYLLFQWSGALKNGSMAYFCKWVIDNSFFGTADAWGASQSILGILGAIPMGIAAVFVVPLTNKSSKKNVILAGMILGSFGGVIAGLSGGNIVGVAIGVALKCLGSAPAAYMILAMLSDVIDHIEYQKGIRTDGLTMSIYSSLMVAGTPICNAIFSALLNKSEYDQMAVVGENIQSAGVQNMISVSYIWVETIAYALCGALMIFWNVEKGQKKEKKN